MGIFDFLNLSKKELTNRCDIETVRGSGPGGQKSDSTESAVRITDPETNISVRVEESRSQSVNKKKAVRRLKTKYALNQRTKVKPETVSIPKSLKQYFAKGISINPKNSHYPFVVKIVLDVFYSLDGRLSDTADVFNVSTNQLIQFVKNDTDLWTTVNDMREEFDHHRLN